MKKIAKVASLCGLMLCSGLLTVTTINSSPTTIVKAAAITKGDLNGGCEAKLSSTTTDIASTFVLKLNGKYDLSGDGLYIRMKNKTAKDTPIMFFMNARNGHRVSLKASATMYKYDANMENKTALTTREFGSYIMLPAKFDGTLFIPYTIFEDYANWAGNTGTTMTYNDVYALYFACSTQYDSYANFQIGDVYSDNGIAYDGSEVAEGDFSNYFAKDYEGTYWTLTRLDGGSEPEEPEYDYTQVTFAGGEIDKSAQFHLSGQASAASEFTSMDIKFDTDVQDFSTSHDLVFRIKNFSYNYPCLLTLTDTDGKTSAVDSSTSTKLKFVDSEGVKNSTCGGNTASVVIPQSFDGYMVMPMSTFVGSADLSKIAKLNINIATYYDYGFNVTFGDAFKLNSTTNSLSQIIDVDALTDTQFSAKYTLAGVTTYGIIDRYVVDKPSKWVGDVKLIDSLNYKDDATLKANVTYDVGDNMVTYNKQDDGVFVHIGPYETGHAYGSYMCLGMFDKGVTTDRKVTYRMNDGTKEYAKGMTMYLKNLSRREIGINLQFDEKSTTAAGTSSERWIVKGYPAIYYAYDVVKDENYTFFAKSDQIQIPVGFEGYVRIPFSSYLVPDWCHGDNFKGTDDVLNLDNFTGNLFLTSDNTRYEDLEFFIKNIGMYFNETDSGFLSEAKTIKANMGL